MCAVLEKSTTIKPIYQSVKKYLHHPLLPLQYNHVSSLISSSSFLCISTALNLESWKPCSLESWLLSSYWSQRASCGSKNSQHCDYPRSVLWTFADVFCVLKRFAQRWTTKAAASMKPCSTPPDIDLTPTPHLTSHVTSHLIAYDKSLPFQARTLTSEQRASLTFKLSSHKLRNFSPITEWLLNLSRVEMRW